MKKTFLLYALAALVLLAGVLVFFSENRPPPELRDSSGMRRNEFAADAAYHFDRPLEIWSPYDYINVLGDDSGTYYLAYYIDANDQLIFFSVYLDNSAQWQKKLEDWYFVDGPISVGACFESTELSALEKSTQEFYAEQIDYSIDDLREYGINPIDSGLHLKYICDTPAQYGDATSGISVPFLSIVLLILSAGLAVFALCLQKDARDAARRAQILHN